MQSLRLGLFSAVVRKTPHDSSFVDVVAGFSSGMVGALVTSPLSLVKVRLQTQGSLVGRQCNYTGVWDGLNKVFRQEGFVGAYRGVWASMCRVGVGSAAQLASYKRCKVFVSENFDVGRVPVIIGSSALSGVVCSLAMNPLDLASTRMYNRSFEYKGVYDVLSRTVKAEGFFALWKGVSAQYSRIVPHTILTILFAEYLGFDFNP